MINLDFCKKRLIASILCANTIFLTMPIDVYASEISGITPSGNTYNIEAAKVSGSTGFRHYDKFNLSQGDVANLIYRNDYSKFVNLVNNQINVNGLVQTLKNGNFYNGHAIFVSPNGMVIGASGVLNVGSLSVFAPTQRAYNSFLDTYNGSSLSLSLSDYEHGADKYNSLIKDSKGNIIVNGRIMAREEVNLYGGNISIGDGSNKSGIIAGVNNNKKYDSNLQALSAFDSLVSNNIKKVDSYQLENGKVKIAANRYYGFDSENEKNLVASININKADIGANEIDISATSEVDRQQKVDLAKANINIQNSNIIGDTVSVIAKASQKKDFDMANPLDDLEFITNTLEDTVLTADPDIPPLTSLWGVAGKAEAEVTVKNSTINAFNKTPDNAENPGLSVLISAEASSETSENANFLTPTIIDFIFNDDSHIGEYFSSDTYNGFEGARSSAIVNIENSTINAIGDNSGSIEISTDASSSLDANNRLLAFVLPVGIYGVGTETVSKATVKNSTLNAAKGDIDVTAVSTNENSTVITSDSTFSVQLENGLYVMLLNNTVKTATEAAILNSTIDTNNFTVFATNLSDSYAEISMEAVAGEKNQNDAEATGNNAFSGSAILNRSNNIVTALIKDSEINTSEDTSVLAQSMHKTENAPDGSVLDKMVQKPKTFDSEMNKKLADIQNKFFKLNIFDKIKGKTPVTAGEGENALFEIGGAVVHNKTNNTTTAKIENSNVKADGDVTVRANTVDLLTNTATSDTQGEAEYGASVAVIVSEQNNTTNAIIDNSNIEADNITVDATTELPMNVGSLTFGMKFPFKICGMDSFFVGGRFASEANGKWDISPALPKTDDEAPIFELSGLAEQNILSNYSALKPKFRMGGFFNNLVQTNSVGGSLSGSVSVVYNEVNTNTLAAIQNNSDVTADSNVVVNSVNSVIGYNGAGLVDIVVKTINYKLPGQQDWVYEPTVDGGTAGVGANFVWDEYTNNAAALIDNSTVKAENGNINVDSATEQSYMNIILTGGKSESISVDGSVHVQNISGDTVSKISNIKGNNVVIADNIEVNAGKATIRTTGGTLKRDNKTNEIKWKQQRKLTEEEEQAHVDPKITYVREAKDEITNIIVNGSLSSQKEEVENGEQNSSGAAVGASVNVSLIDRNVKASIENANAEASNLTVNANTYNQKFDIEGAAAFSGGVKQKQQDASNLQENIDNSQDKKDNEKVNDSLSSIGDDNNDDDENPKEFKEYYNFSNLFNNDKKNDNNDNNEENFNFDLGNLENKFSLSAAGAVDVTKDDTKVTASIDNSELNIEKKLTVNALREAKNILLDGAIGKSQKHGAGAAVSYNNQSGSVKSIINNSNIEFTGDNSELTVKANNKNWILNISIGAGVSVNENDYDLQSAVGGSLNINTINPEVTASIINSTIGADDDTKNINVDVNALNNTDIYNIAGGGAYLSGGENGIGAGAAVNYNNIKNDISAYISNSTLNNINKLSVLADTNNNLNDFAVAGSLVIGADSGWAFDGSADINFIHDTVNSKILGSNITAKDDIEVKANSNSDNLDAAGTIDVMLSEEGGLGANGDLIINIYDNNITAEIGDSYKIGNNLVPVLDKHTNILSAKDIKVAATSTEKSNNILAGVAVSTSGTYLLAAANVNVNLIENTVKSLVSANIGVDEGKVNSLNSAAYDESTLYSRGATVSAAASQEAAAVIAGSVNVDKINKTVESKIQNSNIKTTGDVTASATSVNSLGGTKSDDNKYSRDDVTSKEYRDKLLHKNADNQYDGLQMKKKEGSDTEYVALSQDSDFLNWNMFYDVAAGSNVAISGTGIGKVIENTVTAEISNSEVEADNLYVLADDYSIKNIIAGTIGGSLKGGMGASVLYTRDNSTTSALIDKGSELNIAKTITLDSANKKDNHQILIAGSGAAMGSINANIAINDIEDKVFAKIDNGTTTKDIKAGTVKVNANEDINASHIVVSGGGAQNLAVDVNPVVNTYNATVESSIQNAKVKNAAIDMDANSKINSLDVSAGVAGAAQGFSGVGIAIDNDYTGNIKSYIDNSIINTSKDINIDANSIINANNWIVGGGAAGQGAAVAVNVLLNEVNFVVEAGIKNSNIEKANNIKINTNKDLKDQFDNNAIAVALAGQGLDAIVNVIKNDFTNTVTSYVDNTSSTQIDSLTVNSNSDRHTQNVNFGITLVGEGANLAGNAVVNDIKSTTRSYVDAKSKTLNVDTSININSNDLTAARNSVVMGTGAGLGGTIGVNIDLYDANNLVKSEILSATNGQINSGSVNLNSVLTNALDNTQVDLALGLAAIPIDVQVIKIGQKTGTYSQAEKISNVDKYVSSALSMIPQGLSTSTTQSNNLQTGAISTVSGNVKTALDTNINAKSQIKGLSKKDGKDVLTDELKLDTTAFVATIGSATVGVRDVQIANNTIAEVKNGKVESTYGEVSLNSESNSNVKITNIIGEASGAQVSGGSDIYENSSETLAQIKDSDVNAYNVNVNSKSKSYGTIDTSHIAGSIVGVVNVDLAEAKDTNKTVSLITGNTNINADNNISVHSTVDTVLQSIKLSVPISGVSLVSVMKNDATVNTISRAIIENVEGTINTSGLNIITDYNNMSTTARSNIVSVKAINIAEYNDSGAFMNAYFKSGIDSLDGLTLVNKGTTNIVTARANSQKDILAYGRTHDVSVQGLGIYTGTFANAENNATSATVLKAKNHTSNKLKIDQYLNSKAKADANGTKVTVVGVYAVAADATDKSKMTLDVDGNNTILNRSDIKAVHNATTDADLKAFNLGLLIAGSRIRLDSNMEADTIANIGGNFNVGDVISNIEITTNRNAKLDKSSGTGGIINVADTGVSNTLKGKSILNLNGLKTSLENKNRMTVLNRSENNYYVKTTDGSGGIINVSDTSATSTFNTATEINIENSDINSSSDVSIKAQDNTQIEDYASSTGGGFISYVNGEANNNYTTNAKLNIKNSHIKAADMHISANTGIVQNNGDIHYTGDSGGAVAFDYIDVTNNLTNNSDMNIKNSILQATNNAFLETHSGSDFGQKIESGAYGFLSKASGKANLNVTNNNKITLDNQSAVLANNVLQINLNSSNHLLSSVVSDVSNFTGEPVAKSYVNLTINNTIENNGSATAGNMLDINFMSGSNNYLTQFAESISETAIATTTEDGKLTKIVNNRLDNKTNATMTSGKDIDINYSGGGGKLNSTIHWVTRSGWGLINNEGTSVNIDLQNNNSLNNDGKITAGADNSKYMKINRDGSIDKTTLKGFYDGDYALNEGEFVDGAKFKERKLTEINTELENVNADIAEYSYTVENADTILASLNEQKNDTQAAIDEINSLIENGAVLLESKTGGSGIYAGVSAFDQKIQRDMGCIRYTNTDPAASSKITQAQYNTMMSDYEAARQENGNLTLSEFLAASDYGFSNTQKTNIIKGYNDVNSRLSLTAHGFTKYVGKDGVSYIAAVNPKGEGAAQTCDNITYLNNNIENITNQISTVQDTKTNGAEIIASLKDERRKLLTEYNTIYDTPASEYDYSNGDYSIVFNDIRGSKNARMTINGLTNANITGSGVFDMTKSGMQIDNYSTRSLVFNDITADAASPNSSFVINGKSQAEFADKSQAISGIKAYNYLYPNSVSWLNPEGTPSFDSLPTSGVHYVTKDAGIVGTTINNYYDNNHPLADTFDIPNPTIASNITVNGDIETNSFNILNESGNISITTKDMTTNEINLAAMNGQIDINAHNDSNNAKVTIRPYDKLFAANGININADEVDIKNAGNGITNMKTGYSVRGITITNDMLKKENLIVDPTTGEKNLIKLSDNIVESAIKDVYSQGNIKAIYKDGKIYLYNLPELENDNGIKITAAKGNVAPIATVSTGGQSITINNKTNKELVVGDIVNTSTDGKFSVSGGANKKGNLETHKVAHSKIDIESNGRVSVNGKIENGLDSNGNPLDDSKLIIRAKNGLDIANHQTYDSIKAGGLIDIANTDNGALNVYGRINNKKGTTKLYGSDGLSIYGHVIANEGNVLMTADKANILLAKGSLVVLNKGDIEFYQNDEFGSLIINGQLILFDGEKRLYINGNEKTDNGLIFELNSAEDLTVLSQPLLNNEKNKYSYITKANEVENDYVVSSNMDFGYDVSYDEDFKSSMKILRLNGRGATIVNADNWGIGEQHDISISFDDVNVTVKCLVIKTEKGLAQVKFMNLPKEVANKIAYRYMRISLN